MALNKKNEKLFNQLIHRFCAEEIEFEIFVRIRNDFTRDSTNNEFWLSARAKRNGRVYSIICWPGSYGYEQDKFEMLEITGDNYYGEPDGYLDIDEVITIIKVGDHR